MFRKISLPYINFLRFSLLSLLAASITAQSGGTYVITQSAIDNGGGVHTGGTFDGDKSIGQAVAGKRSSGGLYSIASGFWDALSLGPGCDPPLDPAFGVCGKVTTGFGNHYYGYDVAIQADGKLVVAGAGEQSGTIGFGIARYNTDGTLDITFDGDGKVFTSIGVQDFAQSVVIQPDGKILAVGQAGFSGVGYRLAVARYNSDGSLDTSFDADGIAVESAPIDAQEYSAALQADGKLVITGWSGDSSAPIPTIVRLNPNGSFDTGFDGDGRVLGLPGCTYCYFFDGQVQPDGKIVAVGFDYIESTGGRAGLIARYNSDGTLDTTFDTDGVKIFDAGFSVTRFNSVLLQNDNKIVAGGLLSSSPAPKLFLARFNPDGSFDTSFDTDGIASVTMPGSTQASDGQVAIQANGKIVLSGGVSDFYVVRFQANGSIDNSWGTGGIVTTDLGSSDNCNSILIQPDGKIVAAGVTFVSAQNTFALVRYIGDSVATSTPTNTPTATPIITPTATFTNTPTATPTATSGCTPPPNIISWWPAQNNTTDIVSANNGTLQNGADFTNGFVGRAFSFDGVDDAIFVASNASLNPTSVTVESWVNVANAPIGLSDVITKWGFDASVDSYLLAVYNDGSFLRVFGAIGDGSTGDSGFAGGLLTLNTWYHIAMTYNASTGENDLYLNGSLVTTRFRSGGVFPTNTNVYIGSEDSPEVRFFHGLIDEPTIYGRALSPAEIQAIYNAGSNGKCGAPTPTSTPTPTSGSISGTVTYGNAASPTKYISNVTVTGSGSPTVSTTTAAPGPNAGQYTLSGLNPNSSYTVSLSKTTGQNGITSNDAARVAQHVAGISSFTTDIQRVTADVSGSGTISSNDAAQIARYVAGIAPPVGLTGTWRFFVSPGPTFPVGSSPTTRTYGPGGGNFVGQDFVGLLFGETTGNWTPSAARPVSTRQSAGSDSRVPVGPERGISVELPNLVMPADKEIIVPINVNGLARKEIISYEFNLKYDPSVIQPLAEPVDVEETASRGLSVVVNATVPGLLRVVAYGAMPIGSDEVLLNLRFGAVGHIGAASRIFFERIMFNEGEPMVSSAGGEVRLF